ncbi:troponin C-like isoform X2 [Rhynchophorus ferrugineus]|uniref:troponin C-like isoform X2 n=1 Tax=Rhynchophorus ferrugineus TaxID=354439 RepID=UPI003FCCD55B
MYSLMASDDEQKMAIIRKAFQMFDTTKSGYIETVKIATILNTMGQLFDEKELNNLIRKNDPENTGRVNFDGFCDIAIHFLEEDDAESTQQELKEAFRICRLYDREGNGYITTATLKEILRALDDKLTTRELDGIIAEIDTDGSGTVDFDGWYRGEKWKIIFPTSRRLQELKVQLHNYYYCAVNSDKRCKGKKSKPIVVHYY